MNSFSLPFPGSPKSRLYDISRNPCIDCQAGRQLRCAWDRLFPPQLHQHQPSFSGLVMSVRYWPDNAGKSLRLWRERLQNRAAVVG